MADKPVTREEKYLAYLTGDYTGEIPKPITRKEKYLYELCLKGIGGEISPEEIKNAVNEYLEKNPVKPGATTEQAQQIEQNRTDVASLKKETGSLKEDLGAITESSYKSEVSNYPEKYVEFEKRGLANQYTNMPKIGKIVIKVKVDVIEEFKLIVFDRFENVEFVGLRPTDIYHEINVTPTETGEQDLEFVLPTEISGHFYVALQLVSGTQNKLAITNGKYSDKLQDVYTTTATGNTPRWFQASANYFLCVKMYSKVFAAVDRKLRNDVDVLDSKLNDLEDKNLDNRVTYLEKAIPPKKHTRVILNFEQEDTVPSEYYLERQKLLESYGFKGSFALSNLFFENDGLNEAQINRVIELQNAGHDISLRGGVGSRPSDLDDTSEANQLLWDNYINGAINRAENIGVFNMVGYQCMNNVIGDALYNSLKKAGFKYARVYRTDKYGNDGTDYIKTYTEDGSMSVVNCFGFVNTTEFNSIKTRIDIAVQNGWDFCLMSHNISNNPHSEQTLKSVYIQVLNYLKTLHDNGTVDVVTWHELYQQDNYEESNDFDYNRIVKKLNWLQTK